MVEDGIGFTNFMGITNSSKTQRLAEANIHIAIHCITLLSVHGATTINTLEGTLIKSNAIVEKQPYNLSWPCLMIGFGFRLRIANHRICVYLYMVMYMYMYICIYTTHDLYTSGSYSTL